MPTAVAIRSRLEGVFEEVQARGLAEVIASSYDELVKVSDFTELKGIVKELTEAQKRTEIKVEELAEAQKDTAVEMQKLAKAQKDTAVEIQKLAKAQKDTAVEMQKLTIEMQTFAKGLNETRGEVGGLLRSVSYGFENEVYRMLPPVLRDTYGIELKEKLIRTEIGGKEINILGKAKKDGKDILIIGEAKLRLNERRKKPDVFEELEKKVLAVKAEYKEEVVRVLITHYATKGFMKEAADIEGSSQAIDRELWTVLEWPKR